jgi:hypothetical protein
MADPVTLGLMAGGSIIGGLGQRSASKRQARSAAAQLAFDKQRYREQQERLQPFYEFGAEQLGRLSQAWQDPSSVDITQLPGYGSRMSALESMQAAKGGRFTGGALKEAAEFGGNEYDRYIQQLQHMAGFGTGAASGMGQAGAQFAAASAAPYSAMMQAGGMEAAAPYQAGANLMQNLAFSRMMGGGDTGTASFTDYGGGGYGPTVPQPYSVPSGAWQ